MSQQSRLEEHLKSGRTINRLQALLELGIFELSARVIDLENKGISISKKRVEVTNRFGEKCRVTEYALS